MISVVTLIKEWQKFSLNYQRDTADLLGFEETSRLYGGEGGIRTLEGFNPLHAFQACSFSHSDTSPNSFRMTPKQAAHFKVSTPPIQVKTNPRSDLQFLFQE